MDHGHGNGNSKNLTPNNEDGMLVVVPPKTSGDSSSEPSLESQFSDKTTTSISQESGLDSKAAISSPELSGHSMQASSSQTMGHPLGYDPNRIPSTVFASKPATPMEWSVASNESLFSIQMGNNSFSRDHIFMLYKSGELAKFDDMINVLNHLPPTAELDKVNRRSENMEKGSQVAGELRDTAAEIAEVERNRSADTKKLENDQTAKHKRDILEDPDHIQLKTPLPHHSVNSKSISYRSEGSTNSTRSFAFPVLEGEAGRQSSVKVDVVEKQQSHQQQQQPQPQTSVTTPKTSFGNGWFSCFSLCRIGCC